LEHKECELGYQYRGNCAVLLTSVFGKRTGESEWARVAVFIIMSGYMRVVQYGMKEYEKGTGRPTMGMQSNVEDYLCCYGVRKWPCLGRGISTFFAGRPQASAPTTQYAPLVGTQGRTTRRLLRSSLSTPKRSSPRSAPVGMIRLLGLFTATDPDVARGGGCDTHERLRLYHY